MNAIVWVSLLVAGGVAATRIALFVYWAATDDKDDQQ